MECYSQYIFYVNYTAYDPEDDPACAFLARIALVVDTDRRWSFARVRYGINDDPLKMETVLLPESETLQRIRTLFQAKLEPTQLLPVFLRLIDMSETTEYKYYNEYANVVHPEDYFSGSDDMGKTEFDVAVDYLLGTPIQE